MGVFATRLRSLPSSGCSLNYPAYQAAGSGSQPLAGRSGHRYQECKARGKIQRLWDGGGLYLEVPVGGSKLWLLGVDDGSVASALLSTA